MTAQIPVWLQTTDVILDALVSASWPIAIGLALYGVRGPIAALLSRVKKLNGFGSEAEFLPIEALSDQRADRNDVPQLPMGPQDNLPALPPPDLVFDVLDSRQARQTLEINFPGDNVRQLAWATHDGGT